VARCFLLSVLAVLTSWRVLDARIALYAKEMLESNFLLIASTSKWTDVGGSPDKDGWYRLPLKTYRHAREEIKANKRSMYLKRYAMMDDITQQMDSQLKSTQLQNLAA